MKKKLTSEQILNLPKDEFIRYMQEAEEERYNRMRKIEFPNYQNLDLEGKVDLWCTEINFYMRNQASSGFDEYLMFKPIWYKTMKKLEPDFDLIIDRVFEKFNLYQWEWSKEEYLKRIKDYQK